MVMRSWKRDHRRVFSTFKAFEAVSNLALNLSKTVVIPLWDADIGQLRLATRADTSAIQVCWDNAGKYLGFYIGPGKGSKS